MEATVLPSRLHYHEPCQPGRRQPCRADGSHPGRGRTRPFHASEISTDLIQNHPLCASFFRNRLPSRSKLLIRGGHHRHLGHRGIQRRIDPGGHPRDVLVMAGRMEPMRSARNGCEDRDQTSIRLLRGMTHVTSRQVRLRHEECRPIAHLGTDKETGTDPDFFIRNSRRPQPRDRAFQSDGDLDRKLVPINRRAWRNAFCDGGRLPSCDVQKDTRDSCNICDSVMVRCIKCRRSRKCRNVLL